MDHSVAFVVNPESRGGETGRTWEKKLKVIEKHLTYPFTYRIAKGIGTGVQTTKELIEEGHTMIISVGGEGTANEVVNGIMESRKQVVMGFIKSGTVNDYLKVINWPSSLEEQVKLLNEAKTVKTPLTFCEAIGERSRYGLNVADVGIGTSISYDASVKRSITWIKSGLRYTLLAIKAIVKWRNIPCTITTDNEKIEGNLSLFMAGFSKESGAYRVLPKANPWGEKMAYLAAMNFSKIKMIRLMGILKKGEHEGYPNVHMDFTSKAVIESNEPMMVEVDGEVFGYNTNKIIVKAIPNAIDVISANTKP